MEWLHEHAKDLLILRYGFKIRKETDTEEIVTDSVAAVVDRVRAALSERNDPFAALVVGVDEPWEVCLLKLMVDVVERSAAGNAADLRTDPHGERHEVEEAFRAASRDASRVPHLADLLRRHNLFKEYEDRFFALVRSHARK